MSRDILFNQGSLGDLLYAYEKKLPEEIAALDGHRVLSASFSDLCAHFEGRFFIDVPRLKLDEAHALPPKDTQILLSPHDSFYFRDGGAHYVPGTVFSLVVPFEGDPDLFKYRPGHFYLTHVFGSVSTREPALTLAVTRRDHDAPAVKAEFDGTLKIIQEYLQTQRNEAGPWNLQVAARVRSLLEERKKKAEAALSVAGSLGFPLKRREGAAPVPVTRRRLSVQMPAAATTRYVPEPRLEMQVYDEVLQVVSSLSVMMERSPSAFASMSEEHLRDHILVILNTQFQGQATGETFNKGGKTDILIRVQDRNVFIAECKYWDGPKTLTGAIDQLLSYAPWRDTKLAVIVFNRRKDFSAILASIADTVAAHPQCARRLDYKVEAGFRFTFKQKDDPSREMTLTVLAFDVPGESRDEAPVVPTVSKATPKPARGRSRTK